MRTIELSRGLRTVVDAADYERLSKNRWTCPDGRYAARFTRVNGRVRKLYLAREILQAPAGLQVDHINGDKLDNRRANLRLCTASQNRCNAGRRRNKQHSIYKGVQRGPGGHRWTAQICLQGRKIHLGYFNTEQEAALAYNVAAQRLHGEFARLNNIAGNEFRSARQSGCLGREPLAAGSEGRQ